MILFSQSQGQFPTSPDLTPSQFQYWASLITSFISLLIQSYGQVTFYTWQFKSKPGPRLGGSKSRSWQRLGKAKFRSWKVKIGPENTKRI